MSAKLPKRSSSGNKSDIKTAIIVGLIILVIVQFFLLINKKKEHVTVRDKGAKISVSTVKFTPKPVRPVSPVIEPSKPSVSFKKAVPGFIGKIAFVIDDWGYTTRNCKYLKEIKAPIAAAVLPNLRHTNDVMLCADAAGKDVMLHLPLEPYNNKDQYPENYLITTNMKPALVAKLLEDMLKKMPRIIGVNNHMGSKATEDKPLMKQIFKILRKHGLYFMDSMTSPHHSVCGEVAKDLKVPFASRDVFLDNVNTKEAILVQIEELVQKARKKGYAIAIGHDRDLTMRVLKEQIPILQERGFEIVRVKDLLKNK